MRRKEGIWVSEWQARRGGHDEREGGREGGVTSR